MIFYRLTLRSWDKLVICLDNPVDRYKLKQEKAIIKLYEWSGGLDCSLISMRDEVPEHEKSKEKSLAYARYKGKEFYEKVAKFQDINDAVMPLNKIDNMDNPQSLPNFKPKLWH